MAEITEEQQLTDDPADDGGSLAEALLSAGFGSDGSMPDPESPEADTTASDDADETSEADVPESEEADASDDADVTSEADVPESEEAEAAAPDQQPADSGAATEETVDKADDQATTEETTETADKADEQATTEETEETEEEVVEEPEPISPYDLPGGWYVIHSYSGYENKVKANLATRTSSMHMEDRIFEVVIPMESVVEIKGGRKVEVEKKMFPGYILVRMYLDDDSWYAVRNTPGVTAFVGGGSKPTPLSRREVERFLGVKKEEEKKAPRFKPAWEVGETVRVVNGPFADFNGVIEDINVDQQKVRVLVEIFGRDTPMELNFEDIQKQ